MKRVKLERAVVAAVEAIYGTKGEDRIAARALESDAVQALEDHIQEHECAIPWRRDALWRAGR